MSIECPRCGSRYLRPSRSRTFSETVGRVRFQAPLRCLDCEHRFITRSFPWTDWRYARCPQCYRMDLNGWTGKTFQPPFFMGLKISLGAIRLRCEYCRINFASFRKRKESFTFLRWKKFERGA